MKAFKKEAATILGLCLALSLFCVPAAAADAVIANDETGVPDPYLYQAILERADQNGDGILSRPEAEQIQALEVIGKPVQSL
ncbi:MAG: hypothetical protein HFE86_02510 [Clostridiales bacterium]|nr:hypothetical protein [Clostridiales bacterium]